MSSPCCSLCNGDGLKAVPVKNISKATLLTQSGYVVPDYFVVIEKCDCADSPPNEGALRVSRFHDLMV